MKLRQHQASLGFASKTAIRKRLAEHDFLLDSLEKSEILVLALDQERRIIKFNKVCERATGYTFSEVQHRKIQDFLREDSYNALANPQHQSEITICWLTKSGNDCTVKLSANPYSNSKNKNSYNLYLGQVTSKILPCKILDEHTDNEPFSASLWIVDQDLNILEIVGDGLSKLGLTAKNLVGKPLKQFLRKINLNEQHIYPYQRALKGEEIKYEIRCCARILHCIILPLRSENGTVKAAINIAIDVTKSRKIEDELRHTQEELNTIFNASPTCIWYKDRDGKMLRVNQAAAQSVGVDISLVENQSTYTLFPKEAQAYQRDDRDVIHSGEPKYNIIEPFRDQRGHTRWMRTDKIPYRDKNGHIIGVIAFSLDITERKRIEEELEKLVKQEKEARLEGERLSRIKDEFLVILSHELRTPLVPILGWVDMLIAGKLDHYRCINALKAIERNAKLELQMIEDLLDTSRIITGKLCLNIEDINLEQIIRSAIDTVRLAADSKGIHIELITDGPIDPPIGDSKRLRQVMWNVLGNAIKFSSNDKNIYVRLSQQDSHAIISIQDKGIGISPEFLPYVFERFRQADSSITRNFGGLGLGLALVRHIVEAHGGSITVTSPGKNQGATFTIFLPLPAPQLRYSSCQPGPARFNKTSISSSTKLINLTGVKILLVDDKEDDRDWLCSLLQQQNAEVSCASSAEEAFDIVKRWQPQILLSDIGMPGEDGWSLMRRLRQFGLDSQKVPAIALTAYAAPEDKQKSLASGFQLHLTKPAERGGILQAIADLLSLS